ncbi:MAG: hypothetical protein HUK04_04170 [Bacteroidaceae bacterium]|nr:hypothetical protein [Bacteroidaceae bacterium]MCF0188669.1 hypothetical protein [Bacteroidaceae bacterium]
MGITTSITFKREYLAEYATRKWGDFAGVVQFPKRSGLSGALFYYLQRRPKNAPMDAGNIRIDIPWYWAPKGEKRKPPMQYNYLTEDGQNAIENLVRMVFWWEAHETIHRLRHRRGETILGAVECFMSRYRIRSISEDAVLKSYQRWLKGLKEQKKRMKNIAK